MFARKPQTKVVAKYPDGCALLDAGKNLPVQDRFFITDITDKSEVPTRLLDWVRTGKVQSPGGLPSEGFRGYLRCFLELHEDGNMSYLLRPEVAELFAEHKEVMENITNAQDRLREITEQIQAIEISKKDENLASQP
jgi:hypothetical protein